MQHARVILDLLKEKTLDEIFPELIELLDSGDQEALFTLLAEIDKPLHFPLIRTLDMLSCRFERSSGRIVSAIAIPVFMNGTHRLDIKGAANSFTRSGLETASSQVEIIPSIFQLNAVKNLLPGQIRQLNKKLLGLENATELKLPFHTPESYIGYGIILGFITRKKEKFFRDYPEKTLYKWRDQFEKATTGIRIFRPQENWALAIAEACARDSLTPAQIAIDKCRQMTSGEIHGNLAAENNNLHLHLLSESKELIDIVILEGLWVDMDFAIAEIEQDLDKIHRYDNPAKMPRPRLNS